MTQITDLLVDLEFTEEVDAELADPANLKIEVGDGKRFHKLEGNDT